MTSTVKPGCIADLLGSMARLAGARCPCQACGGAIHLPSGEENSSDWKKDVPIDGEVFAPVAPRPRPRVPARSPCRPPRIAGAADAKMAAANDN